MNNGPRLLLDGALALATCDDTRREIADASVLISNGFVERVGTRDEVASYIALDESIRAPARRIDATGCVVVPGLINGHHHLYQTLTRTIGTAGGLALFDWLKRLYPIWAEITPDDIHVSAKLGLAELLLSGATTVADHLYLFPNGARVDDEIDAARELGIRFVATRGSMTVGEGDGGLPPDSLVEAEDDVLADSLRLIEKYHGHGTNAMVNIALAPCSPFSVSANVMRESARLARSHRAVGLHTHLAETLDEQRYCLARFGMRPLEYAESLEWAGSDVWFAHMVHPNAGEIAHMARHGTGVCHCPSSNMILASGIAPVRSMIDAGVRIGLGVDGSASNDGNHMLGEARQAMLLQRVGWPGFESRADRFSAREALWLATRGGASILGRADLGRIEQGYPADLVAFRVDGMAHSGALADPIAALLTCAPASAWCSIVAGRPLVVEGIIDGLDLGSLVAHHRRASRALLHRAGLIS